MGLLLHPEFISTIHSTRLRNNHRYVPQKIISFSPFSSFPQTKTSIQLKLAFFTLKFQKGLNKSAETAENRLLLPLLLSSLSVLLFVLQGSARTPFRACRTGLISLPGQTLVSVDFLSVTQLLASFFFAKRVFSSASSGWYFRKYFSDNYSQ